MAGTVEDITMSQFAASDLRFAVDRVYSEIPAVLSGRDGEVIEEQLLWHELSCCILSSQVSYDLARAAADAIEQAGVLCCNAQSWETLAQDVHYVLSGSFNVAGRAWRYRFPNTKSCQIARTWAAIRAKSQTLTSFLREFDDVTGVREWMVLHAPGLGPKQSSMFLRNVGLTLDLAVLDRHVLRYMEAIELLDRGGPYPTNLQKYEDTEFILRSYADELGYRVGLLDWAIWVVMRVAKSKGLAMESAV